MSWLTGWSYRKSITLSRPSGTVTYYQMKVIVGESSGSVGYSVDLGGLCKSDFSDLRFTNADNVLLDYWIESVSNTTPNQLATVWVEFDSILAIDTTFYMYYGNADGLAVSNGVNTFPFFDHFDGSAIDTDKWFQWVGLGNTSVAGSILTIAGINTTTYNGWGAKLKYGTNFAFRTLIKTTSDSVGTDVCIFGVDDRSATGIYSGAGADTAQIQHVSASKYYANRVNGGSINNITRADSITSYTIAEIRRVSSTNLKYYLSDILKGSASTNLPVDDLGIIFYTNHSSSSILVDWCLVRKYIETEPVFGAWGSQSIISSIKRPLCNYNGIIKELDSSDSVPAPLGIVLNSSATAENDVLVGAPTPFGSWVKKTLVEFKAILGLGTAAYTASTAYDAAGTAAGMIASSISDGDTTHAPDGNSVFDALALKAPLISPSLVTPALGIPASGNLVNCTGFPGKNRIINGGFTINQRGYAAAATLATGAYGHDRWKAGADGGNYSFTQLKSPTTVTIASGKTLIQVVEDANVDSSAYILSWIGTAQGRYAVNSATPTGSYAASPILITGQTPGTVMSVEFNTGTLGNVQLEKGSVATEFESRLIVTELALCQRYYQRLTFAADGYCNTNLGYVMPSITWTPMRVIPSWVLIAGPTSSSNVYSNELASYANNSGCYALRVTLAGRVYAFGTTFESSGAEL